MYEPTLQDIAWAKRTVTLLKNGGVWGCSWGMYQINKTEKKVELLMVNPAFAKDELNDLFHMTEQTFKAIGYTVDQTGGN
jgi:hypothetical protein